MARFNTTRLVRMHEVVPPDGAEVQQLAVSVLQTPLGDTLVLSDRRTGEAVLYVVLTTLDVVVLGMELGKRIGSIEEG